MSQELLNFHQVVSEIQIAEDNLLEHHRTVADELLEGYNQMTRLHSLADHVTYDQEGKS